MLNIKQIIENPIKIWGIIMSIFIIGLGNIYQIHTKGMESIFPILEKITSKEIWETISCGGILKINERNILYILFINIIFLLIFNSGYNFVTKYNTLDKAYGGNYKGVYSMEYIYLISLGLLGLNIIVLSNDLIFIFISLELYSLSVYLLILLKITKNTTRMSIIYLLINSLSSYLFLLGISIIYKNTGSLILDEISYMLNNPDISNMLNMGILLLIVSILIKLGTIPFNFWVIRLYTSLESRILLYQIIIPKLVYIFLLYKIYTNLLPLNIQDNKFINMVSILILVIAILSIIVASIGGLFNTYFKSILAYSSILNMGFILLSIGNNSKYASPLMEYLFIYTCNTLALFYGFLLIDSKSNLFNKHTNVTNKINFNKMYPIFTILLLISIFSFIGIPPFGGFFAKINIFINLMNSNNEWWLISIIFLLIGTFISSCFYLKFILFFFFRNNYSGTLITETPISITYYFSFFTILIASYPFISNYLYPFYSIFLIN